MKATLQIATENKPAANDLNLNSKWKEHLEIKNEKDKSKTERL